MESSAIKSCKIFGGGKGRGKNRYVCVKVSLSHTVSDIQIQIIIVYISSKFQLFSEWGRRQFLLPVKYIHTNTI